MEPLGFHRALLFFNLPYPYTPSLGYQKRVHPGTQSGKTAQLAQLEVMFS